MIAVMADLLPWLLNRHSEDEVFRRIVAYIEARAAEAGRVAVRDAVEPAIAFVDLAGYTQFTEAAGDQEAAVLAARLQDLAMSAARTHQGRVVKLLGDGVMLRFGSPVEAVRGVLGLMHAIDAAGLPPAHAGVTSGPVVVRDADVYGHTVNLAARIAGHAPSAQLLVTADLRQVLAATESRSWTRDGHASRACRTRWRCSRSSAEQRCDLMPVDPEILAANARSTERIRAIAEHLTEDAMRHPVGEHWTVAITLAHLAFWDRRAHDSLRRSVAANAPTAADVDIVVNDLSLPLWAAVPPSDAVRLALDAASEIDAFVATLDGPLAGVLLDAHPRWVRRHLHRDEHLDEAEAALRGGASG